MITNNFSSDKHICPHCGKIRLDTYTHGLPTFIGLPCACGKRKYRQYRPTTQIGEILKPNFSIKSELFSELLIEKLKSKRKIFYKTDYIRWVDLLIALKEINQDG